MVSGSCASDLPTGGLTGFLNRGNLHRAATCARLTPAGIHEGTDVGHDRPPYPLPAAVGLPPDESGRNRDPKPAPAIAPFAPQPELQIFLLFRTEQRHVRACEMVTLESERGL